VKPNGVAAVDHLPDVDPEPVAEGAVCPPGDATPGTFSSSLTISASGPIRDDLSRASKQQQAIFVQRAVPDDLGDVGSGTRLPGRRARGEREEKSLPTDPARGEAGRMSRRCAWQVVVEDDELALLQVP
jgi:hypothetical protein